MPTRRFSIMSSRPKPSPPPTWLRWATTSASPAGRPSTEVGTPRTANEEPIVFVLSQPDLLGQGSVPGAILAGALLSGMRTLAAEGHRANAVAVGADANPEDLQHWIAQLEAGRGVAGELVRVQAAHVGKVQV